MPKVIKIAVMIANQSEDIETIAPIDLWRRAGFIVELVSIGVKNSVILQQGNKISCMGILSKTNISQFNAIYLPGGKGHLEYLNPKIDAKLRNTLSKNFINNNKWILAMCASPSVLIQWDLINQRYFTCYPGFEKGLEQYYQDQPVVVSQGLITGRSPAAAIDFALAVIEALDSKKTANKIRKEILLS